MLVWNAGIGAAYDPGTDTWTAISEDTGIDPWQDRPPALGATAVWTGREMIIWGGRDGQKNYQAYDVGARYDPKTDTWSPVTGGDRPVAHYDHSAVWTGEAMLIWGGVIADRRISAEVGVRYRPLWLTVLSPTVRSEEDGQEVGPTEAGDVYRVIDVISDRALVQLLGDPPSIRSLIPIDDRVRITSTYPDAEAR